MPNITPNPVTVIPPKTSGGSVKNPANLIAYSAAAEGPQSELWANVVKSLRDLQSQVDGIANSLRANLAFPDPVQVVDSKGSLVANIGTYINPVTNTSFSGIWAKYLNLATDANPMSNGAVGDGVADDTAAVQATINQNGLLYVPPEKTFKITSTITLPAAPFLVYVWGGGQISSTTATPLLSMTGGLNLFVEDIVLSQSTAAGTAFSLASNTSFLVTFHNVYMSSTATCLALNSNGVQSIRMSNCTFVAATTGIALTTQTDVLVTNCQFRGSITPVSTSGTCTYNLVGCNVPPHFGAPVLKQYAEFTGTTQTITAGAGFTAVTSCTFTISATGTWQIMANAFVQQASAAANSATIRFTRAGVADSHQAGSGSPPAAEFLLHIDTQIACTSGDVIVLQCSAVGVNASLLGTGNTGTTNISGVFLST